MADMLRVQRGARPWAPAPGIGLGEVLHRHNIPLIGLVQQGGHTFLYACLIGEGDTANVWAYSRLETAEEARLLGAEDDDFDAVVNELLSDRPLTLAIAFDWEIEESSVLDAGQEGFLTTADRFLTRVMKRWERAHARADQLEKNSELISC
ncbi:hypothetical protein ACI2LF_06010 [Kribbella sp. NPDC020789]